MIGNSDYELALFVARLIAALQDRRQSHAKPRGSSIWSMNRLVSRWAVRGVQTLSRNNVSLPQTVSAQRSTNVRAN